jgi:hypothetical protein
MDLASLVKLDITRARNIKIYRTTYTKPLTKLLNPLLKARLAK